jgi:hypothetical protein
MIEIWIKHHLVSDGNCNVMNLKCQMLLQGLTKKMVRLAFSVGDATHVAYNKYWPRQRELVTLTTIFRSSTRFTSFPKATYIFGMWCIKNGIIIHQGYLTHKPRVVTMKLWVPKRKCPKAVPTYLQHHVIWSRSCEVVCDRALNQMLFQWISIHSDLTHDRTK